MCILSDLDELIHHGQLKNLASATPVNINTQTGASQSGPRAYTKEKGESIGNLSLFNHDAGNMIFP